MIDEKTIKKIKSVALKLDHDMAFDGKSKGNKHLLRAVEIAKLLAVKSGANKSIVEAGTLLHDTPLSKGEDSDYLQNKEVITKILIPLDLTKDESNAIAECVASHEGTFAPQTLEAKVVHDADVLEKVGILGIIRHTWKLTNTSKINPNLVDDHDIRTITNHIKWRISKLQLPLSKKIANYLNISLNLKKLKDIVGSTAVMAKKGIITEKIAESITKCLNNTEREKLKEQLSLSFLKKFT